MPAGGSSPPSPLLPLHSPTTSRKPSSRKLSAGPVSEKAKGKQRALSPDPLAPPSSPSTGAPRRRLSRNNRSPPPSDEEEDELPISTGKGKGKGKAKDGGEEGEEEEGRRGRCVTVLFSNDGGGNLEVWVEEGETVGSVKDQIRHLRPSLAGHSLKLIHSGRLLTDGILLLSWLRSLEERVRRQAAGVTGDVESVLKEVGVPVALPHRTESSAQMVADGDERLPSPSSPGTAISTSTKQPAPMVWLHCSVGSKIPTTPPADDADGEGKDEAALEGGAGAAPEPRRRGFDTLLDAGLSPADVAAMRRQFYESRGEEVPEGLDAGDVNDEHARALEEQWIEGDLTADTATTTEEGLYTSTMHGLLAGFLFGFIPMFWFREQPLPQLFDSEHEALEAEREGRSAPAHEHSRSPADETLASGVYGTRMQMGIILGFAVNIAFGALRFLN